LLLREDAEVFVGDDGSSEFEFSIEAGRGRSPEGKGIKTV